MFSEQPSNASYYSLNRQDLPNDLRSLLTFLDDFDERSLNDKLILAGSITSLMCELQNIEPKAEDIRTFMRLSESYYAHTLDANLRVQVIVNPPKNPEDWSSLIGNIRDIALILARDQSGELNKDKAKHEIHSRIALLMSTAFSQMELEVSIRLSKKINEQDLTYPPDPDYIDKLDQTILGRLYFLAVFSGISKGQKVNVPDQSFQDNAIKWLNLLLYGKNEITDSATSFKGLMQKLSRDIDPTHLRNILDGYKGLLVEGLKTFNIQKEALYTPIPDFEFPDKALNFYGISLNLPKTNAVTFLFERAARIIVNQNPKVQIEFSKKLKEIPEMMFLCEALRDSASTLMADNLIRGLSLMLAWSSPPPKHLDSFPILKIVDDFPPERQAHYIANLTQLAPFFFENKGDDFFREGIGMLCSYMKTIKR